MPRLRIIILEKTRDDKTAFNVALWLDVPASRQSFFASATAVSKWIGATAADNLNLQSGAMVETVIPYEAAGGRTLAEIRADLQAAWQEAQNGVNNNNPWVRYGSNWDGVTWVAAGAA